MRTIPPTLAAFVAADWTLDWLCTACNVYEWNTIDLISAIQSLGPAYPTRTFMTEFKCPRCGRKASMADRSPKDRKPIEDDDARPGWMKR